MPTYQSTCLPTYLLAYFWDKWIKCARLKIFSQCLNTGFALSMKPRLCPGKLWPNHHVVLCWLVEGMMVWSPCGAVLAGGLHGDLTTMWCFVGWWNAQWSDHHVVLIWLMECMMIWPPCGVVLAGGMHDDLTTMWCRVGWWNAWWSDHHVVPCWLVECTMIWPPCGAVSAGGMCWLVECMMI